MTPPCSSARRAPATRRRARFAVLAGVLGAVLQAACGTERSRPPNLLLITTDTTRADHLGCYGYSRPTSPNIDALAGESVRFERCFSHVPITLPAHASILSGTFPNFHGVRDNGRFVVPAELTTLAERLKERGYSTAAFVSAFVLDSRYGLDQGFDLYDDDYTEEWSEEKLRDARIYNQMVTDRPADQTTARALRWLDRRRERPFFLWLHYYDPHQRYDPPHPYGQLFHDSPYDGEIAFMDSQIGRVFEALKSRKLWSETAVVLTADHGEGLGQHGEQTHGILTYDATLRVALLIKPPARSRIAAGVVEDGVSHVDILPTVAELLGLAPAQGLHGRSLVPLMRGRPGSSRPAYFETTLPRFSFGWEPLFGLRSDGWKYIHGPRPELYNLVDDPGELYNLAASETATLKALEDQLFRLLSATRPPPGMAPGGVDLDAEARKQLAALGYVGGSASGPEDLNPRIASGRRSPVDGLTYLADFYLAGGLAGRGRLEEAAAIYRLNLVPLDPENPSFLSDLANLERRLGRPDRSFELYRRAQAADPQDPSILVELGQLEADRGRMEAAEVLFNSAFELAPQNLTAAYLRAFVAASGGRPEAAISRYREALKIDPSHHSSRINLAIELAKTGQLAAARTRLQGVLRDSPLSARAHYNLGLLELGDDRPEAAQKAFQLALRYRRPYPAARLGLATVWRKLGREVMARRELEVLISEAPQSPAAEKARQSLASPGGDR